MNLLITLLYFFIILLIGLPVDLLILVFYLNFNYWGDKVKLWWDRARFRICVRLQEFYLERVTFYQERILHREEKLEEVKYNV